MVDATTVPDCIVGIEGVNTAQLKSKLHQFLAESTRIQVLDKGGAT